MLDFLKKHQQQHTLKQMMDFPRVKKIENFAQVRTLGLVFTVGDEKHWNTLYHFTTEQVKQGKQVWLAGFQSAKTEINYIFSYAQTVICHEKEDINFFGIPRANILDNFLQQHFDLVIDTTSEPNFFGQYVSLKALANLKVTFVDDSQPHESNTERIFDLLIHGPRPMELSDYLNEVTRCLTLIKK
ncbi:MAG: hypothetical protein IJ684_02080 [Bacteroidales bacterium]|nr:hypothetical protein [Bacteroidales bacterium]